MLLDDWSIRRIKMLDDRVKQLLLEFFAGHVCAKCGKQAVRMRRGNFFCEEHHLLIGKPIGVKQAKDPKFSKAKGTT